MPARTVSALQNSASALFACAFMRDCSISFATITYQLPILMTTSNNKTSLATRSLCVHRDARPYGFVSFSAPDFGLAEDVANGVGWVVEAAAVAAMVSAGLDACAWAANSHPLLARQAPTSMAARKACGKSRKMQKMRCCQCVAIRQHRPGHAAKPPGFHQAGADRAGRNTK